MERKDKKYSFRDAVIALIPDSNDCKKAISFLTLLTAVGSIITLVCSAYVAEKFSDYYGVHASNLNILSTAKDMIVIFAPLLFFILIARYINILIVSIANECISNLEFACKIVISCFLILLYVFSFSARQFDNTVQMFYEEIPYFSLVISTVYLMVQFIGFVFFSKKIDNIYISMIIMLLFCISCIALGYSAMKKFNKMFNPMVIRSYEVVRIEDVDYAVISSSNDSKIAIKCEINGKSMEIHYGKYRFIQSKDYEFEYRTFDNVNRDIDS